MAPTVRIALRAPCRTIVSAFKNHQIMHGPRSLAWRTSALATLGTMAAVVVQSVFAGSGQIAATPSLTWALIWALILPLIVGMCTHRLVSRSLSPMRCLAAKGDQTAFGIVHLSLSGGIPTEVQPLVDALRDVSSKHEETVAAVRSIYTDLNHDLRTPLHTLALQTEVTLIAPRSAEEYEALLRSNLEEFARLATATDRTLQALRELALRRHES